MLGDMSMLGDNEPPEDLTRDWVSTSDAQGYNLSTSVRLKTILIL
jgi:hypothetical protein